METPDKVFGHGYDYDVRIGFHPYERHIRQKVVVDFEAWTDWRDSAKRDRARSLVDYYEVNKAILALVAQKEWRLLEAMAEDIARTICLGFPVSAVRVRATKTPFDMPNTRAVAVECMRRPEDFAEGGAAAKSPAKKKTPTVRRSKAGSTPKAAVKGR